jgi:hypothetical protein
VQARFEAIVGQPTDYPTSIGSVLKEMRDHQADLLRVLDRPDLPLQDGLSSIRSPCRRNTGG